MNEDQNNLIPQNTVPQIAVTFGNSISKAPTHQPIQFVPITWIPLSQLRQHRNFQRDIKKSRVDHFVKTFDARLFGAITIARFPDGRLSEGPIDGMHRVETLAALCPDQDILVPCFVVNVVDEREEALIFEMLNQERTRIDKSEIFRSKLFREEPQTVSMTEIIEKAGWGFNPAVRSTPWNVLNRGSAAMDIYKKSPEMLFDTLVLAREIWPFQAETKQETVIRGVYYLLKDYSNQRGWKRENIVQILGRIALKTILRNLVMQSSGSYEKRGMFTADAFAMTYNENKKQNWTRLSVPKRFVDPISENL